MVVQAGPQIRRQALIRSLKLVLRALAARAPTVVVLEDVHWIDEASSEVLKEILGDVPGLRLLALVAQLPGWTAPWTLWGWTERITVRPLSESDAALLAGAVLHGMPFSRDLETYMGERAGGNPFFVEELLRALEETGELVQSNGRMALAPGAAERLPSTLTEILLARLDRLEGQVRSVAQVASVIGRNFAVRLLAQVMEREKTKRHKTVLIDGVVMIAGSVYILLVNGNLVGFLQLLADGPAAWTGVVSSTRPREN